MYLYDTQRHQLATRACTNVFIPRVNHEFSKRNIRFSIAKIFNNSPDIIINKYSPTVSMDSPPILKDTLLKGIKLLVLLLSVIYVEHN